MTAYFIDPSASTNGTGTTASPFNTLAGLPAQAGALYLVKRGTTYNGAITGYVGGNSTVGQTYFGAYANADGSDNVTLPRPIINMGNNALLRNIDYCKFTWLDLRSTFALASDVPIWFIGNNCEISDCYLTSNLMAIYSIAMSNVNILRNKITVATANSTSYSMSGIVCAGDASQVQDSVTIEDNTMLIGEGGNPGSFGIKIQTSMSTNLKVRGNTINTVSGTMSTNLGRIGIGVYMTTGTLDPTSTLGVEISGNNVTNMLSGIRVADTTNAWIHHNTLNGNANFGLHLTTVTSGCLIEWNTCRRNGGNYAGRDYWGRGIEMSAGAEENACTRHTVRFNDCSYNYNWGGDYDNATEGVGIGLDDGTSLCLVYGNLCYKNEGQGIGFYNGGMSPTANTGGNVITGNWCIGNGSYSYKNRRSGTMYLTNGAAQIGIAGAVGIPNVVINNLIKGGPLGVAVYDTGDTTTKIQANVFTDQTLAAIIVPSTYVISDNIYSTNTPMAIGDLTTDSNGVPTPVLRSNGSTNDRKIDPQFDSQYVPLAGSPLLTARAGYSWTWPLAELQPSDA